MIPATLSTIKKCVGFLFIQQNKKIIAVGTGFFVSVPTEYDTNSSYMYFVTAKHVLQNKDGNFHEMFGIRLNKHSGDSDIIWVSKEKLQIFTHSDPDVDIAIFSWAPDQKIFDYLILGQDFFLNDEMMTANKIEEGTDVLFTGLFTSHIGQKRNQPIVRFGKTALISDEKVEWKEEGKPPQMLELYLMECQSFGGNSGSPVFFKPDRLREIEKLKVKGETHYLAGVMKGYFNANSPIQVTQTDYQLFATQNSGIAAIIPSHLLHDILFCEELNKIRKDNDQKMIEQKSKTEIEKTEKKN